MKRFFIVVVCLLLIPFAIILDYGTLAMGKMVLRDIPKAKNEGRQGMDIKTIEQIIRNIPNPYPKDIFTPIDSATLKEIHKLLMREMNMPLDRLSGEIARRVIEAFREQVIREIKVYLDED